MLIAVASTRFLKDTRLAQRRGLNLAKLEEVISVLCSQQALPARFRDHGLTGEWVGYRDCHIQPDWLLIYKADGEHLLLARTGTHSDLFSK